MTELTKFMIIGAIGAFVAMMFYLEELVTDTLYDVKKIKELGVLRILFLSFANGVFGSVIMITCFFGITQYYPEFNPYFAGGISAMFAFMGKDGIRIAHKMAKNKVKADS